MQDQLDEPILPTCPLRETWPNEPRRDTFGTRFSLEPSALESIRTITNSLRTLPAVFSPASKNVPGTSAPSSQRSTAHSYGRFVGSPNAASVTTNPSPPWSPYTAPLVEQPAPEPEPEHITWASWDNLDGKRRLLLLGYSSGLQIWDVTSIDTMQEVLNVNLTSFVAADGIWAVRQALVLPTPPRRNDEFAEARPLVAIVVKEVSQSPSFGPTEVLAYSLRTHTVVKRLGMLPLDDPKFGMEHSPVEGSEPGEDFSHVFEVAANNNFIVITTHSPARIHILSPTSLSIIYTIPQEALTPSPSSSSLTDAPPHPTFSLTPRFLAFASPPPLPHHRPRKSGPGSVASSAASGFSPTLGAIGAGSIDLVGSGAKKVGEGMWMGVRALSGLAFGTSSPQPPTPAPPVIPDPRTATFFSRSAPSAALNTGPSPPSGLLLSPNLSPLSPMASKRSSMTSGESVLHPPAESGYVTVLDLAPLTRGTGRPTQIAHFLGTSIPSSVLPSSTPHAYAIQTISFSPSGTMLCVCDVNGHGAKVFQIRGGLRGLRNPNNWSVPEDMQSTIIIAGRVPPTPRRRSSGASSTSSHSVAPSRTSEVWHMYDLVRGSTHAKVDRICWSDDARWVGIGTARGTLHMYAINPYGGKPDELSHLDGRVRNPASLQSWPATVHPVTRLKATAKEGFPAPVYTFLPIAASKSSSILSPSLDRPSRSAPSQSTLRSASAPGLGDSLYTKTGFQDVLAFASLTGLLTLRRCTVSLAMTGAPDDPRTATAKARRGSASTSPVDYPRSLPVSGVSMMMSLVGASSTQEAGLKASESLLASWDLKRERTWDEVKDSMAATRPGKHSRRATDKADALSRAELSTCSRSPQILPPPIYLSHQYNFFSLQEDWHALLRQARLDLPIRKIEVRKEVEITPQGYSSSAGSVPRSMSRVEEHETFIQETDITSSSIERPIATAIHTNIDSQAAEAVMPSFPNAYKPSSWRDTIVPVRHVAAGVADGVNEGLGRIKREINKARAKSPAREPTLDAVPSLAFEEDDEAIFEEHNELQESGHLVSGDMASAGGSGSTPSTTTHLDTDDAWSTNHDEITQVLAEEASFDEIGVPGFMMEEEEERRRIKEQLSAATTAKAGKKGGRKKGKK